jgi:probable blue pigment (indigoidine) exporter
VTAAGQERVGLLFAALCALSGAFVPALAKLTTGRADPLFVATVSNLFAALAAILVLGLRGELGAIVRRGVAVRLFVIGALATAGAHLLFYLGASRTNAIVATLCLQIEPAYALLLAWLVLGHRPTARRIVATLLLLVGIGFAIGGSRLEASSGVWLLLATPLCWQLSHLIVLRQLTGVPPPILAGARYIYGAAVLLLVWLSAGGRSTVPDLSVTASVLPLLAVQGCVLGYVGTLFWYQAITRLDLARTTAIVVPAIPLLSFAASFLLLGEIASARQWLGLVLTAAGILVFVSAPHAVRLAPPAHRSAASAKRTSRE